MTLEHLQRVCTQRGIRIARAGAGYRLTGAGVSLLIADLRQVTDFDLEPVPLGRALESHEREGRTHG